MRSKTEMNEQTNSNTDAEEPRGVVYVVDDDEGVRDSLQYLLEASQYLVYTFASAENFLAQFDPHAIAVLVLDVRMPGMSGLQLQEELLARKAALPIVFVTGHGDVSMAVSTMKKGAVDFIEKPFNQADLKALVDRLLVQARERAAAVERERMNAVLLARLTAREQQVLERIVAGRLNKQIAADLGISIKTVEAHRANIMDKLEANTVADLMRVALRSVAPAEG
jgi:two-component system, LuxR family, response regulator TtrR